mgnify:FL=1
MAMIKEADLPDTLPLFPLPGALLLPRSKLPLQIFEPRYLAMMEDCLRTRQRLIGMIQPQEDGVFAIGCAGRISSFSETEDGRYLITLTGIARFRLLEEVPGFTPYLRARVDWSDYPRDIGHAETDPSLDREEFLDLLHRFMESHSLSTDWGSLKEAEDEMLINALSQLLPLEVEDRQALLEAPTLTERREVLTTLLEYGLHGGSKEEIMQ